MIQIKSEFNLVDNSTLQVNGTKDGCPRAKYLLVMQRK